ncbi:gamma-butyrobetaine dioxygenase-like [Stegodyphus dumicola]|uniref:gamma-butyrobetaine dioxygenase-like n=1 Tax=Stegodyphus dumicola TaxID=202533 RepID=UPI0015A8E478|nr:gamma-butyrobetaine dioxygenase-like [Stegodyphus dumicola]
MPWLSVLRTMSRKTIQQGLCNSLKTFTKANVNFHKSSCNFVYNIPFSISKAFRAEQNNLCIEFQDSTSAKFPFVWLRDNCPCDQCVHFESKQKLLDTIALDFSIEPEQFHVIDNGSLKITWKTMNNKEHVSIYKPSWLHKYGLGFQLNMNMSVHNVLPPIKTWDRNKILGCIPELTYELLMESEDGLKHVLENIYHYGLVIIRGVPCAKGEVMKIMKKFAFTMDTKWATNFQIITQPLQTDPNHLRYTRRQLEIHTDMNYLEKSPAIQAVHCLNAIYEDASSSCPGKSVFVDGYHVANLLKKENPAFYYILSTTPVKFKIYGHGLHYENEQYIICVNRKGEVAEVHYNNRTMAPFEGPADHIISFYEAYKMFGQKLRDEQYQFTFIMKPGDMIIFNNMRVLHGQNGFDPNFAFRHLEGCYGDLDEVIARYRSLIEKKTLT